MKIAIVGAGKLGKYLAGNFQHFILKIKCFKLFLSQLNRIQYKTIETDCLAYLFPGRLIKLRFTAPEMGF